MKTICPHCKQEFPDTPDEYLGVTLECPVCKKEFVCEKAKYCSECGAVSPARAITCHQCGKTFPLVPPEPRVVPAPGQNDFGADAGSYSEYDEDDCFLEEVDLSTPWRKAADFSGRSCRKECWLYALPVALICAVLGHFVPALNNILTLVLLLVSVPLGIRRLHDMGISGWFIIVFVIAPILWLVLLICPSQPGANKWGPNPVGVSADGRSRSMVKYILIIIGAIIALVLFVGIPPLFQAREAARRVHCEGNLKMINAALRMYALDFRDCLPHDPEVLRTIPYLSEDDGKCPSSPKGYIYLGNGLKFDGRDGDIPIVMDSPSNHGKFINVLLKDGYVRGCPLRRETHSCVEALNELFPNLSRSREGRIILENARKVDEAQIR